MSAWDLALAFLGPPREEDRSAVAELQLEITSPGLAVFMKSIHSMVIDVDPVQTAASKAILVCAQGLIDLLEVVIPDGE